MEESNLVRFDWAIKRLLRNKADFVVVEGLLKVLLGRDVQIQKLLESEGNQQAQDDKFNRVDVLAEDENGDLIIFEIQNSRELDYFHRMAYGTSKVISEYLKLGDPYEKIKKVYSINIVYFSLGLGGDYAYHGKTEFVSMHNPNDKLLLTKAQSEAFKCETPSDIFPEYYLLRVDMFDKVAKTPLDEWISFLKTGDIPLTANAPGLKEAREKMRIDGLTSEEKSNYYRMMENLRYQRSVIATGRAEGRAEGLAEGRAEGRAEGLAEGRAEGLAEGKAEGLAEGRAEGRAEGLAEGREGGLMFAARQMKEIGVSIETIAEKLNLTIDQVKNA